MWFNLRSTRWWFWFHCVHFLTFAHVFTVFKIKQKHSVDSVWWIYWMHETRILIPIAQNAYFNSDGDFHHFMSDISKTRFSAILIKTAVHRAQYCVSCGRHRFSRIFIDAKICWNMPWLNHYQFPQSSTLYENNESRTMRALS